MPCAPAVCQSGPVRGPCYISADNRTPRGREAGANPAQSRYGGRPSRAQVRSPIPWFDARTFERKGRQTDAHHRRGPLARPPSRGVRRFPGPRLLTVVTTRGESITHTHLALGRAAGIRGRPLLLAAGGLAALAVALVLGVGFGSVSIEPADTVAILAHRLLGIDLGREYSAAAETIVMDLRLPRVLTAMLVGAGAGRGRSHVPGPAAQPAGRPVRARDLVRGRPRRRDRGAHPGARSRSSSSGCSRHSRSSGRCSRSTRSTGCRARPALPR